VQRFSYVTVHFDTAFFDGCQSIIRHVRNALEAVKKWVVVILNRKGGRISEIFGMRILYVPGSSTCIKMRGETGLAVEFSCKR